MRNKKRISILAVVLAFAIIFTGAFAFFSDSAMFNDSAKVGTFDIDVEGGLTHSGGLNNLNPGDNDPTVPTENRPGSDHELSFEVNNLGNKSAITRAKIYVYGTGANGNPLTQEELSQIIVSERNEGKEVAGDNDGDKYQQVTDNSILDASDFKEGKLIYIVGNNDDWTLDGTEENETVADGSSIIKTFDIGLRQEVGNPDGTTIKYGNLEGANIHIDVEVQAIQYRNTGDPVWETIFTDSSNVETPVEEMEVAFDFVKTWENDTFEDRPDEITVEIYGTTNARAAGELLRTQTIKVSDDLDKDGDPNTWEYTIEGIETTYRNFYMVERSEDDRYEVTENFIAPANNERVRPMTGLNFKTVLEVTKIWEDNDNTAGLRPESVMFNIYYNTVNDESSKELFCTLELFESDCILHYINPIYPLRDDWDASVDDWDAYIYFEDVLPSYMWIEELDLLDNYSMSYTFDGVYEKIFTVTNTLVNTEPPRLMMRYNAILTNTFVE